MFKQNLSLVLRVLMAWCGALALSASASGATPWTTLPPVPELPQPVESGHTSIGDARLWWGRYNVAAPGVPVLLLHGGLGSSNYFSHLIPVLISDGRSVIAIDSRGHGRSTLGTAKLSYALMTSDVIAVLSQLRVAKVDIVGWSDGGIIGLELAIGHPELVSRLYAFGANVDPDGERPGAENTPTFHEYLSRGGQDYARLSPTPDGFGSLVQNVSSMWSTEPHLTHAQLQSIKAPVTVADGQFEEAILPQHTFYIAQTIPNANLELLPNVSHFAMLQQPDTFNESVIFFLHRR